jgi:hypothetical protein
MERMIVSEFYIGYQPNAPRGIRSRVRRTVLGMFVLAAAGALLFASSQRDFADSQFVFGKPPEFSGTIVEQPFPSLFVNAFGDTITPYLLCAPGKHGADSFVNGWAGKTARLQGPLIYRQEGLMIELVPGSITEETPAPARSPVPRDFGEFTLQGEIVDTKCFLGVMNPGEGKVHRDCATRCLSGGIPPALLTRDFDHTSRILLLTDSASKPLAKSAYLAIVGQPVRVHGRVVEADGLYYLQTSRADIAALP